MLLAVLLLSFFLLDFSISFAMCRVVHPSDLPVQICTQESDSLEDADDRALGRASPICRRSYNQSQFR